jgi:xanthine dehydrogenase accessory factor
MHKGNSALVLLRGGGDLATGIALRLHHAGIKLLITELPQPLAVRRTVSYAEAVYEGQHTIEGVVARLVRQELLMQTFEAGEIPVLIDPNADILLSSPFFAVVVDARLIKQTPSPLPIPVPLHIGLGPGFHAGVNCHAAIETRRSHTLGRVYWNGATQPDSGQPEGDPRRVLRSPSDGVLLGKAKIGEHVEEGQVVAVIQPVILREPLLDARGIAENISDTLRGVYPAQSRGAQSDLEVISPFSGVLRGLIRDGIHVTKGLKIGDVDPRDDPSACLLVSDKSLAIGGGVLEAILTREEIREKLWK